MKIDGKTAMYAILGDPIAHVAAPRLMNAIFQESNENKVLIPFHVHDNGLQSVVEGLKNIQNFKGAVITMPHKTEIIKYVDEVSTEALRIGACNVIKRTPDGLIKGTLLDGNGFIEGLKKYNYTLTEKHIFLLGAGGAAAAIAFALCENGIKKLTIYNRTDTKALLLIEKLKRFYPSIDISYSNHISNDIDVLINSTSVGMKISDKPVLSLTNLNPNTLVADIITHPEITCTLQKAKELGCTIHTGIEMLEGQIKLIKEFMD
ncbi:hypothetical protein [uncultured Kordia sp.]|uniref:shikimate dehydrogenase family protein n=1 Tax=uncultured Kordia sp. TaxID=507699 RepID=UPI0026218502|nr:hypothetical protein [uncultured Kordia sp.]